LTPKHLNTSSDYGLGSFGFRPTPPWR